MESNNDQYDDMETPDQFTEEIEDATESPTTDTVPNVTNVNSEKQNSEKVNEVRLVQLPLARVKNIMKLDPDMHSASSEAVFLVTKATELFIESLAKESFVHTVHAKKKTIQKRDVDMAIQSVDSLIFLEGTM